MPRRNRHCDHEASRSDARDDTWIQRDELLRGVLDVQVDSNFQYESNHLHSSWLVLYLTRTENSPHPHVMNALPKRIEMVLRAVASLVAESERLRLRQADHLAFWTRVLTSEMMVRPLTAGDTTMWWVAKHTREREVRLTIQWEHKLERALLAPLKTFLVSHWDVHELVASRDSTLQLRSMRAAISLAKTQLTPKDIELLTEVILRQRDEPNSQPKRSSKPLFHETLAFLQFRETALRADALHAIASRVIPLGRSFDELRLEAVFPTSLKSTNEPAQTPQYVAAFKRVLDATFDASHCGGDASSVGLSLAYNDLHPVHLKALEAALRNATRGLTFLSLKYALDIPRTYEDPLSRDLIETLERIIFGTESSTDCDGGDCALDISGSLLPIVETMMFADALTDRVQRTMPLVESALAKGQCVTCRCSAGSILWDQNEYVLDVNHNFTVVSVVDDEHIRIQLPTLGVTEDNTAALRSTNVVQLAVEGTPLFQSRFTRLIQDGDDENRSFQEGGKGCASTLLFSRLGPWLTHLSLRWHGYLCLDQEYYRLIGACRNLRLLNLEGSTPYGYVEMEWLDDFKPLDRLATLNLNATLANDAIVRNLIDKLREMPQLKLKYLALAQNHLTPQNLTQLGSLLSIRPSLQLLEIGGVTHEDDLAIQDEYSATRCTLTEDNDDLILDFEPLSVASKLAFLSVVDSHISSTTSSMDVTTLASIFDMAGEPVRRQILWSDVKPTLTLKHTRNCCWEPEA